MGLIFNVLTWASELNPVCFAAALWVHLLFVPDSEI